ncbi:MAG TPA: protein kinase [Vicinamibacterales bacterium]|nr:protein kinase [Vicinamibacterales bacterium]
MALTPGTRLGPYEVRSSIGAGGMGEVFRATDTRLKREVAIKVLPRALASDPARLARFQREAEVLASLNHPHIAAIYGLEEADGLKALVLELVEGETLADRIARGRLPVDEALAIARQIADALEAAHEKGIVHRDLKPANVKLAVDGQVKVLDFGLAKAMDADSSGAVAGGASMSPTMTSPAMTQAGMILGTAAYMSPEQARGRAVDARADIWAFGVVLYEMVTGATLFAGDTVTDVLAAVVTKEPDWSGVPARLRPLLERCLEKDPKRRLRHIGDIDLLLTPLPAPAGVNTPAGRTMSIGGWVLAAALLAVLIAAVWWRSAPTTTVERGPVRFQIGRALDVYNRTASAFAVSPDGQLLAYYAAGPDGPQTLFVRTLATGDARAVPQSATATPLANSLFWSPDSRQLVRGTAAGGQVFDVAGGTVRPLCDCRYVGGTWNRDGTILLGAFGRGVSRGIRRLAPGDRSPTEIIAADASREVVDTWPVFLPDGRRFLFTRSTAGAGDATYLGTLDGGEPVRISDGSRRVFVPATGGRGAYLLGIDATGLVAQPFDLDTMSVTRTATVIIGGAAAVSVSETGVLATSVAGSRPLTIATWFDRGGAARGQIGQPGFIEGIALSPDGRKLATAERGAGTTGVQIWLDDLVSGVRTRATFSGGSNSTPVWSPEGTTLAFTSGRDGRNLPYRRAADGTGGEVPLFPYDWHAWVNDWLADGQWVLFSSPPRAQEGSNDLWAIPVTGSAERKPVPYLVGPDIQQQAQFSPDGRFVAYGSDQGGTFEIYVQPFPNASEGKWMISNGGGVEPRWSRDGKELFYFAGQALMRVPVTLQPTFSAGVPTALFEAPIQPGYSQDSHRWQLSPDGQRFLLLANAGTGQGTPLDVIVNWTALLPK